jgi:glyoxylase-like metal-dependent hydrolase (beta-lactamase superfamily II)
MEQTAPVRGSAAAEAAELRWKHFASGVIECQGTVVWNELTRSAVLIDATDDPDPFLEFIAGNRLVLKHLLLTHAHVDHAAGTDRVARETGLVPRLHRDDWELYAQLPAWAVRFGIDASAPVVAPSPIEDGDRVEVEDGFRLKVLHTPGHTPGQVAFHVPEIGLVVVGDTLFQGSVGRTDLPGGDFATLERSIRNKLYALPGETVVVPGHGPTTTIGRERVSNPYVRA